MTKLEGIELRNAILNVLSTEILMKTKFIIACQKNIVTINKDLALLMEKEIELSQYITECESTLKLLHIIVDGKYELLEENKTEYEDSQKEYTDKINGIKEVIENILKEETEAEILMMGIEDFPEYLPASANSISRYMLA